MPIPLLLSPQAVRDGQWYDRLAAILKHTNEVYAHLGPCSARLAELYGQFTASGDKLSPDLAPEAAMAGPIAAERSRLEVLLHDIEGQEKDERIRQAYADRLRELLASADLYTAALNSDCAAFRNLNQVLYGTPDKQIYAAVCATFAGWAAEWPEQYPQLKPLADSVIASLPAVRADPARLEPDPALFRRQQDLHNGPGGYFAALFSPLTPPRHDVTEAEGNEFVRRLIGNLGGAFELVDSADSYWGVRYNPNVVLRPAHYRLTAEQFNGLVCGHEIGSHILERLNGQRQPLRLLSLGLKGYDKTNEGRALIREQIAYPQWSDFAGQWRWYEILRRHFAISYAMGLDGGGERGFSQVFAALHNLDMLWTRAHGAADDAAVRELVRLQSWELATRVLKGTDGSGSAYLKDIVYLEGNLHCWRLAAEDETVIMLGDHGKANLTDREQVELLRGFVPLP